MNVIRKDATIQNTDDTFPGAFEVVLSTPAKDRDGDELALEDWKTPLPEHITFDADHGMSVATTVGSGVPSIEDGNLIVRGTYSSLPRAQEVRTLVNEGHIRTTSVAFMTERYAKSGTGKPDAVRRELLNGAFVAIPSNREAVVLASKSVAVDAAGRHSPDDMTHLRAIYDHAVALGAIPTGDSADAKALDPNAMVSVNLSGSAGGFDVNINAWCVPAAEIDAYADAAQRALTAALDIASGGPVDDDNDSESTAVDNAAPSGDAAKSAEADALELKYRVMSAQLAAYTAD